MSARNLDSFSVPAFEKGDVDVGNFDHEAHVYVGWLYLEKWQTAEAIERFTAALKRLTVQLGVPGKYHETITWFYMLAIAERRRQGESWLQFRAANTDLLDRSDNILQRYYRPATLATERARSGFVLPDLLAA